MADLNRLYRDEPSLHAHDFDAAGFEWVAIDDAAASVVAYLRKSDAGPPLLGVCNLTPLPRHDHAVGVPEAGRWVERMNTDAAIYGGAGIGNFGGVDATPRPWHGRPCSVRLTLPPLATLVLAFARGAEPADRA